MGFMEPINFEKRVLQSINFGFENTKLGLDFNPVFQATFVHLCEKKKSGTHELKKIIGATDTWRK